MRLASANKVRSTKKSRPGEQASLRIILLALVSYFLGVAVTVFWYQVAAKHNAGNSGFQTAGQPSAGQPIPSAASAQSPASPAVANQPLINPGATEEVKRMIPDFASLPVEDGENILRTTALKEFAAAAKEMDVQVQHAQQQLLQAESSRSEAEQQAAMKHLQQTQAAQAEKLQQIAARLQAQIAALKSLKNQH